MAALGAAAGEYGRSALGLHAYTESVGLGTVTAVRLKCALRHGSALLYLLFRGDFSMLVGIDFVRYLRDLQYSRLQSPRQSAAHDLQFSLGVVQLSSKRNFSLKDTLRGPLNRASIGFVQERNLHVRLSHCRSTESHQIYSVPMHAPSTRENHGTPGVNISGGFAAFSFV